jgi:hypothetical protein
MLFLYEFIKKVNNMSRYLFLLLFLFPFASHAEEDIQFYTVGDTIESITLQDQYDKTSTVDESTKLVLFTTGMKGGKVIRKAIEDHKPDYLAKNNALFISNISGMPGFIARTFALPSMKKHKYSIVLDREGKVTEKFPSRKKSTTIIHLDNLKITSISFTKDSDEVTKAIN